jgi:hypothetical protein
MARKTVEGLVSAAITRDGDAVAARRALGVYPGIPVACNGTPALDADTVFLMVSDMTDGSTTFTDLAHPSVTVTRVGTAVCHKSAGAGLTRSGIYFPGTTGDYLTLPHHTDYDLRSGPFTVEAWVRLLTQPVGASAILSLGSFETDYGSWSFGFYPSTERMEFTVHTGGPGGPNTAHTSNDLCTAYPRTPHLDGATMCHYVCQRTGTGSNAAVFYCNGLLCGTTTIPEDLSLSLAVGLMQVGIRVDVTPNEPTNALVATIRVSKVARYSGQVIVP